MNPANTSVPRTAIEFQDLFRTEKDCAAAIAKLRWPNGFVCPNCGHDDAFYISTRHLYQCAVCKHQTSITAGTIFHKTRVKLRHWFWMIYCVSVDKGGASSSRIARELGMYQKTVWHILHKIRHAMGRRDEGIALAGLIECDTAFIGAGARKTGRRKLGKEAYNPNRVKGERRLGRPTPRRSKKKTQTAVLVLIEDEGAASGNVAMKVLDYAVRWDLAEIVEQRADPCQHFKTDLWQPNFVLRSMGHKLQAKKSDGPEAVVWLPHVHRAISLFKRFLLGTYHGVSAKYLPGYLQEFCFRFNRRQKQEIIWHSLLKACCYTVPLTYSELTV